MNILLIYRPPTRVVCGGIFTRCRRHPSLQESGATSRAWEPTSPPWATPQQTSCWDLLPSPPLATIHGGRIQTEELIAFPAPLTSSSACPVLTAPSPLNNTTIIYPLIIGHSTPAPSCIVFVSVKSANSEGLTDKQAFSIYLANFFQGPHFWDFCNTTLVR